MRMRETRLRLERLNASTPRLRRSRASGRGSAVRPLSVARSFRICNPGQVNVRPSRCRSDHEWSNGSGHSGMQHEDARWRLSCLAQNSVSSGEWPKVKRPLRPTPRHEEASKIALENTSHVSICRVDAPAVSNRASICGIQQLGLALDRNRVGFRSVSRIERRSTAPWADRRRTMSIDLRVMPDAGLSTDREDRKWWRDLAFHRRSVRMVGVRESTVIRSGCQASGWMAIIGPLRRPRKTGPDDDGEPPCDNIERGRTDASATTT